MTDSARDAFTYFDVDVSTLSDEECDQAADLILSRFGGLTPDIKQIVAVVAEVSAESDSSVVPGGLRELGSSSVNRPSEQGETVPTDPAKRALSAHPVSTRCTSCTPRWMVSPSGGGFFHERSCELKPNQKIYRASTEAKQTQRLRTEHKREDRRTGLHLVPRRERIPPFAVHAACEAAFADNGRPCSRCIPLLHPASCDCEVCSEWMFKADEL